MVMAPYQWATVLDNGRKWFIVVHTIRQQQAAITSFLDFALGQRCTRHRQLAATCGKAWNATDGIAHLELKRMQVQLKCHGSWSSMSMEVCQHLAGFHHVWIPTGTELSNCIPQCTRLWFGSFCTTLLSIPCILHGKDFTHPFWIHLGCSCAPASLIIPPSQRGRWPPFHVIRSE